MFFAQTMYGTELATSASDSRICAHVHELLQVAAQALLHHNVDAVRVLVHALELHCVPAVLQPAEGVSNIVST